MKKLAIFDLDGTLLNTISDLGASCNYALKVLGYAEHPISAYNYMVGNGVRKLIERAQPDAYMENSVSIMTSTAPTPPCLIRASPSSLRS